MAAMSFKDYMVVDYRPGEPEEIKYRAYKRKRNSNLNGVEEENDVDEELSIQGRRKLARSAKRRKRALQIARKRQMKKMANKDRLGRRAQKSARAQFKTKLAGGPISGASDAKKKSIERRLSQANFKNRISVLQRRLMPKKRRAEISRKR